jgi:hypothetical protein
MPGPGPTPVNHASECQMAMKTAHHLYEDPISTVAAITGDAQLAQVGGLDLVLQANLEGAWMWVTDLYDNLPWDRTNLQGWWAGIYQGRMDQTEPGRTPIVFDETDDPSMTALDQVVRSVLAQFRRQPRPQPS